MIPGDPPRAFQATRWWQDGVESPPSQPGRGSGGTRQKGGDGLGTPKVKLSAFVWTIRA